MSTSSTADQPRIMAEGTISADDWARAAALHGTKNWPMIGLAALVGLFFLATVGDLLIDFQKEVDVQDMLPQLIQMAIAVIIFPFLMSSGKWRPREPVGSAVALLATRDGLQLQTLQGTSTYAWDRIARYKRSDTLLLLYTSQRGSYHLIPRHWFDREDH